MEAVLQHPCGIFANGAWSSMPVQNLSSGDERMDCAEKGGPRAVYWGWHRQIKVGILPMDQVLVSTLLNTKGGQTPRCFRPALVARCLTLQTVIRFVHSSRMDMPTSYKSSTSSTA